VCVRHDIPLGSKRERGREGVKEGEMGMGGGEREEGGSEGGMCVCVWRERESARA
jgi:hypothetical protein